jgi:hypothetical protein
MVWQKALTNQETHLQHSTFMRPYNSRNRISERIVNIMTTATPEKPVSIEALEATMLIEQVPKPRVKAKKNGAKPQIDLEEWNLKVADLKRRIDQSEGDILQAYVDLGAVLNHVKKLLKHGKWTPRGSKAKGSSFSVLGGTGV